MNGVKDKGGLYLMSGSARGSDFISMVGIEAEIRDAIDASLTATSECGCGSVAVDGVDAAAVAVVKLLQDKGIQL